MTSVEQVEQAERKGGRPRSEDADRAIIDAALDLVADVGVTPLSIEQVAARAGVGKATVYRRWPNKDALIVDALATLKGPIPELPGNSLREDVRLLLVLQNRDRQAGRNRRLYSCMMSEMGRHPDLARRFRETVIAPRQKAMSEALRAAVTRGELRDDLDVELMRHLIAAPILHWMMNNPEEPVDEELMTRFLDAILEGLAVKR